MSELEKKDNEIADETKSEQVAPEAAEEAGADASAQTVDLAEEANRTLEAVKQELESVIKSAKSAFADIKKQLSPLRDGISEVGETLKNLGTDNAEGAEGEKEPRKIFVVGEAEPEDEVEETEEEEVEDEEEEDADDEAEDEADADEDEDNSEDDENDEPGRQLDMAVVSAAAHEASDILSDGFNKLKDHASNIKFDFKSAISKEFEQYADKNLKDSDYAVDENGKRVVKIDGKFIQEHASDVVPTLIRGAVGSFFKAFLGTDILADESEKAEAAKDGEAKEGEAKADAENSESKYRVQFDFSNTLKDAIRTAKVTPAAETDEEIKEREAGREVLIEGAQLVEDAMNGKPTDDARDRLQAAYKHGSLDDSEKAPEEIQAVDEKHQKILDLAKQFEDSANHQP